MLPGTAASIEIELFPTSVRFEKGHRLRVSLAGADAGNFERVPATNPVRWRVYRDRTHPSRIELPVREPSHGAAAPP
jgi:predicted acyl esterase